MNVPITGGRLRLVRRSKPLWAFWIGATFVVGALVVTAAPPTAGASTRVHPVLHVRFDGATASVFDVIAYRFADLLSLVPLVALVYSYGSIVRDVETGRLRTVLSMPCSRGRLYDETLLAQLVGFLVPTLCVLAVAGTAMVAAGSGQRSYLYVVLAVSLLAFASIAVGVAISASVSTTNRGIAVVFVVYGLVLVAQPLAVLRSGLPYGLLFLNPLFAATSLLTSSTTNLVLPGGATAVEQSTPLYLTDWTAVLVLLGWAAVSTLVGRRRLQRVPLDAP